MGVRKRETDGRDGEAGGGGGGDRDRETETERSCNIAHYSLSSEGPIAAVT